MKGLYTTGLAALLVAQPALAQVSGPTIRGTVQDERGGAIAQAVVDITCGSTKTQTRTDAQGQFRQSGLPAAACTVGANADLFVRETVTVDLSKGDASTRFVLRVSGFTTEVQVTATRRVEEELARLPQGASVTGRAQIDARPYQLVAQTLREEPGILVQQTTSGQTSPTIRGFTGQSNVFLLDGIRFNNASWRAGPSQYTAWVDAAAVDRIEIVRGPSSVQYGSDSLGGTVHVLTSKPAFSSGGLRVGGDVSASFGSAETSAAGDANLVVQFPDAAFRMGLSTRSVGDIRGGRAIDSHAAVTRFLGLSSSIINSDLPDTAYEQSGGYITGRVRAGRQAVVDVLYMHENQSGASRYDRIWGGDGLYRSGFDPQTLDFGLVRYERTGTFGLDSIAGAFSYNRQADGRFEQTRPTAVIDRQEAATAAFGYQVEASRRIRSAHRLSMGAELYDEEISDAFREQVPTSGASTPQRPDIPNGTKYRSFGTYVQDVYDIVPERVSVRGGLRYSHFHFSTTPDPQFGVVDESVTMQTVTFNAGTVIGITKYLSATFNVSRGFRAPNSSDLGSVGLTGGGGFSIAPSAAEVYGGLVGTTLGTDAVSTGEPIPSLGPEEIYAYEPGLRLRAGPVTASLTLFDLEFHDAVQRRAIIFPTNVVGSIIYGYELVRQDPSGLAYIAQDSRPINTAINADRSRVKGFEADGHVRIAEGWDAYGYFSMSNGHLLATGEPMRRMSPPMGGGRLRWSRDRTWIEGLVTFARAQTRLNAGDVTDARIGGNRTRAAIATYFTGTATDLGLVQNGILLETGETVTQVQNRVLGTANQAPLFTEGAGFMIVGARAGFRLHSHVDLTVIGANLTDRNYRLYGSGVDGTGINVTLRTTFRF
jgi:outer membrane receptor protein involved in Fe transport